MDPYEEGETILLKLLRKRNILFVDDPAADFVGVVSPRVLNVRDPAYCRRAQRDLHHFFNQK
jgi:hypothetical protein